MECYVHSKRKQNVTKKIKLFSLIFVVSVELYVFSYAVCLYFVRFCVFCHDLYFEISTSALSQQYCAQALADCRKALLVWYLEEASMGQVPGAGMLDIQVSSVKECSGFCLVVLMWRTQSW